MVDWHGSGGGSGAADPSWSGRYFSYGGRVIPVMAPTDARTGSAELAGRRSLAEARLADGIELPDPDTEEWRYSRISDLDLDAWAAAPADAGAPVPAEVTELLGSFGHLAGAVVLVDGEVAWVPGVPPAERFRLDGPAKGALRLTWQGPCSP